MRVPVQLLTNLNPYRTAVSLDQFWEQTIRNLTGLSPKRDSGSKNGKPRQNRSPVLGVNYLKIGGFAPKRDCGPKRVNMNQSDPKYILYYMGTSENP